MQIQWLGLAAFRIQTQHSVIVTDPYADSSGLKLGKLKADITIVSNADDSLSNNTKRLSGDPFIIDAPGEYEVNGTFVYGLPTAPMVSVIEDEGMMVAHLGLLDSELKNEHLEVVEGADILLLPIGTLDKKKRATLVSQIEPRIIIPYLYKQPKIKPSYETVDGFLKEMGSKSAETVDKFTIKKNQLPQEDTIVTILKPNQ